MRSGITNLELYDYVTVEFSADGLWLIQPVQMFILDKDRISYG